MNSLVNDTGKKIVKKVIEEVAEIPKQAVREVVEVSSTSEESPIVEAMQQRSPNISQGIAGEGEGRRRLNYLQKELEEIRRKKILEEREALLAERARARQESEEKKVKQAPFFEPPTKRKIGLPFFARRRTKGSGEILKTAK